MAVIAIGALAAYGASAAGFAAYAGLAYAVASTAATMLLAKKTQVSQEGSRLTDLKNSTSAYGNGIPINYGTTRQGGNMIWGPDLIETKHVDTQSQGGKGGGGAEVTSTTYTYSANCAFLLGEGVIKGVKRIWAQGSLVYDLDEANDGYVGDLQAKLKVYPGTEEQLPDPTIESIEGVGNVEAYRGWAYIVFTGLQLATFSNAIPSFTFEVINSDDEVLIVNSVMVQLTVGDGSGAYTGTGSYGNAYNPVNKSIVAIGGLKNSMVKYNPFSDTIDAVLPYNNSNTFTRNSGNIDFTYDGNVICYGFQNGTNGVFLLDGDTLGIKRFCKQADFQRLKTMTQSFYGCDKHVWSNNLLQYFGLYYSDDYGDRNKLQLLIYDYTFTPSTFQEIAINKRINMAMNKNTFYYNRKTSIGVGNTSNGTAWDLDPQTSRIYYAVYQSANTTTFPVGVDNNRVLALSYVDLNSFQHNEEYVTIINDSVTASMNVYDVMFDQTSRSLFITYSGADTISGSGNATHIMKFNVDSNTITFDKQLTTSTPNGIIDQDGIGWTLSPYINYWTKDNNARKIFYGYNAETGGTNGIFATVKVDMDLGTYEIYKSNYQTNPDPNHFKNMSYVPDLTTIVLFGYQFNGGAQIIKNIGKRYQNGSYNLSEVVTDLATRSGLTVSDIDVSTLTSDVVDGYIIAGTTTIRGCLEQLAQAYNFDITETDWKLKFVKCGSSSVKNIYYKELSAGSYSPDMTFENGLITTDTQELELPQLVNLTYLDIDNDYQQNTQDCARYTVSTQEIQDITLPLSFTATQAKQIAQRLMYNFWVQRDSYTFETNYDYIELEPCDVVTVTTDEAIYTMKITKVERDGGIMKFTAICEDNAVYTQLGIGANGKDQSQVIQALSTTRTYFLDIPILQASDDNAGFYIAVTPQSNNLKWNGSSLYSSPDNNNGAYTNVDSFYAESIVGSTVTLLPNFIGGYVPDYDNYVDVKILAGSLSSITEDQLFNGYNVALIGGELVSFQYATLTGTNQYRLSKLLRGRWNTEDQINTHTINDQFVLLNTATTRRIISDQSMINMLRFYKNVTFGKTLNETAMTSFKNTAKGLQCYAVYDFQSNRMLNGDCNISWKPRVRGNGLLQDGQDVYDPDGDNYQIDIMNSAKTLVLRTIVVNGLRNYTYTSAMQIADFGTNQTTINMNIYKINAIVGRGKVSSVVA